MSEVPSSQDPLSEVDDLYRRLSALDPARPGEWVRRKVQAYAAQQAAERALRASAKAKESSSSEAPTPRAPAIPAPAKQAASKPWLLPVTFGAIAAVALAGFLVVPRFMAPRNTQKSAPVLAPVSQPEPSTPQIAQALAPGSTEPVSPAPPSPTLQSSEPPVATSPSPVTSPPSAPKSSATTSLARTPVALTSSTPTTPVVTSPSAGTPAAESPTHARVARQNAPLQGAPIANDRTGTTAQAARPAATADLAPASKAPPTPSADTEVAPAQPPAATPSATQPAPAPAAAVSNSPGDLWLAAKSGDMTGLQAALTGNVDVNALSAEGQTALILAIQNNHVDIVRTLLAHGANPNTPDAHGHTPIRAARVRNNFAVIKALENNGRP